MEKFYEVMIAICVVIMLILAFAVAFMMIRTGLTMM